MSLIERDAEIEAGWNALGYRRNPQHDVFIADGINRLRATHSEAMEDMRQQLQGAVEALDEWLAASEGLKAVDTSDGTAIRAALDRVDTAKASARAVVGRR